MTERHSQSLPRGRHGLPREVIARSQRERILVALAETMAERGYAATSVADVIAAAGVSRATFYEQFNSKEDCFMTAFELATAIAVTPGMSAGESGPSPRERFERGLDGYLRALAGAPAMAKLFLIEVYAVGPEGGRRRAAAMERYVQALGVQLGVEGEEDWFAVRTLVAALSMMATMALARDDIDAIPALREPMMRLVERLGLI